MVFPRGFVLWEFVTVFVIQFPLFALGYTLRRRDAAAVLARDQRPPILYLRPFRQERIVSPGSEMWEALTERHLDKMGVAFIIAFILWIGGAWLLSLAGLGWLGMIPVVVGFAYVIFVLYRRLRRLNQVTLEQEIGHHLRSQGPFVAVGGPRDWFAPPGAARIYLDDDAWQSTVADYVRKAQIIVLHLVPDGWTWWEFCQCARASVPTRLLAVVAGDFLSEEEYARLRSQLYSECGINLRPRRGKVDLITFDSAWNAHYLQIEIVHWLWWPFRAFKIRRTTFAPLLKRDTPARPNAVEGEERP
jgi:hypothetical protein